MTAMANYIGDYLDDLHGALSPEECLSVTLNHVGKLGFQNVVFTYSQKPSGRNGELPPYLRVCPESL